MHDGTQASTNDAAGTITLSDPALETVYGGYGAALNQAIQVGTHQFHLNVRRTWGPGGLHAVGRAADLTGSEANMEAFFNWASHTHPRELLHAQMGYGYLRGARMSGGPGSLYQRALAQSTDGHRRHVHVAY